MRLLLLFCVLTVGCGGNDEDLFLQTPAGLNSISVKPRVVDVGSGFSIPFNEPFSFQTAQVTDPKSAQLQLVARLSNGATLELPIEPETTSFSPLNDKASISSYGSVSVGSLELCGDTLEVTATYRMEGTTYSDTFTVNTACFVATAGSGETRAEPFIAQGGIYQGGFVGQFRGPDGVDLVLTATDLSYSLKTDIAGVSVAHENGEIRVSESVPAGRRLTVLVSYDDPQTGLTFRSQVEFEVQPG